MKPAPLTNEILDELSGFNPETYFTPFIKARFLRDCKKALKVDPAYAYMCMGIVYGYADDFDSMIESFQSALRLSPGDILVLQNYASTLTNFGRYDEVINLISPLDHTNLSSDGFTHILLRSLSGKLELDLLGKFSAKYVERAKNTIDRLNLAESDARDLMLLFNSVMHRKQVRFGVQFNASWRLDGDSTYLYYDFMGTAEEAMTIMDEFDQLVRDANKSQIASKVCIILLPIKSQTVA